LSIHVALNHVMHYRYDRRVMLGPQIVRLRPAPHCRTRILSYALKVDPAEHFINWQQDPQSNWLARLMFEKPTEELRIEVDLTAEIAVVNPFDFFLEPQAQQFPFRYDAADERDLAPYLATGPATPLLTKYLTGISRERRPTVDFLVELNRRLAADVRYVIRLEQGIQTPETTLAQRSGSCRDSSELLVQLLRHLGLAARFVSGYLIQLVADAKPLDGPAGPTEDFTDLHAWCEVYLPGAGWIGLDPTSGLLTGEGHIPLAATPDPQSAAPLSGAVERCETKFDYSMRLVRAWEAPRVTKPYAEAQWSAIDQLGQRIDERLAADDVRLTMGGEPTFVSSEDARAGMEHRGAGRRQAPNRGRALPPPEGALRTRGTRAFRPGQVVSRRAAAPLVTQLLLAYGRRADLGGRSAVCGRDSRVRGRGGERAAAARRCSRAPAPRARACFPGV
jgi:transglutaminase-like putative cysteine protease